MSDGISAGWYPDPDDDGASVRYWDGRTWTEQTRPADRDPEIPAGWYADPDDGGDQQANPCEGQCGAPAHAASLRGYNAKGSAKGSATDDAAAASEPSAPPA